MTTQLADPAKTPVAALVEEFEVLLVSEDQEPGYGVFCLSLPGCVSQGDDREHALEMITEAIDLCIKFPPRWERRPYDKDAVAREWESVGCTVESAVVRVPR